MKKKKEQYMQTIERSADTLTFLISDLVDFAALETGTLHIKKEPTDVVTILSDIQERMEVLGDKKGVVFRLEKKADRLTVSGDPGRLSQALQNLAANALHYTPSGGTVTLTAENSNGRARISVRDTGIGISKEDLPKIFDRFFQAEGARELRKEGFGLGLNIASEILRAHGGDIQVESELGKGTTFRITLPLKDGA